MQSRELVMGAATAAVALTLQRFFASRSLVLHGPGVVAKLIQEQSSVTSAAVIDFLQDDADFVRLSKAETVDIIARDKEDDDKLADGIKIAVERGVLTDITPAPYNQIQVQGKTVTQVTDEIIELLDDGGDGGGVLCIVGLSGTGKGTTVSKLKSVLPKAVTWSNGNIFRSLTLLACTWCEQQKLGGFDTAKALTSENLSMFMGMLSFGKFGKDGAFDTRIKGLGLEYLVSEVQNTVLKEKRIGKNIPSVANVTQGDVVLFIRDATRQMSAEGFNVLIEGRKATMDHILTPYRFELALADTQMIGRRRAAQRIMAGALKVLEPELKRADRAELTPGEVGVVLKAQLRGLMKELS